MIIVGSGAGGAAAAYRLVLADLNVLVLEKGAPLPRDGSTLDDERVVTRGEFLSKEPWLDVNGNAICPEEHFNLGGKTKWYGAAVLRYSPREFEADLEFGARGWPISHADLEPYYGEAERLLGARTFPCEPGLERILARLSAANPAWQSSPLPMALSPDILRNHREATHFDGFASASNLKGDAESGFLNRIADRPNLEIRTGAEVDNLLPAIIGGARIGSDARIGADTHIDAGTQIGGVRLTNGEELRAPIVLLAAGALHSPRLLSRYLAARDPTSQVSGLDAVGRNLKKHVLTALVAISLSPQTDLLRKTMITTHRDYPHSSVQPLGFDGDLMATLVPKFVPRMLARAIGRRAYGFFLQTEDGSHPDNRVFERPGGGADEPSEKRAPLRVMDYDAARTPASQREHRAFTQAFQRDLLRIGWLSFTQPVGLNGTAHVDGTLIAGHDPKDAVVGPNGGVLGIPGLYVVDGSILPRSSRVNPSLSIYAWSLRVADLLAKSLRPPR